MAYLLQKHRYVCRPFNVQIIRYVGLLECLRYMNFCVRSSARRCADGQADRQLDGQAQTYKRIGARTDEQTSKQTERLMNGRLRTDTRADRQTDKCKTEKIGSNQLYSRFLTRPESNKTVFDHRRCLIITL